MNWSDRFKKAIDLAENLKQIEYIEERIRSDPNRPNYRTVEGRKIRDELLKKTNEKAEEIAINEPPF